MGVGRGYSGFFYCALQRVLGLSGGGHYLACFCFRYFERIYSAKSAAVLVNLHHDCRRVLARFIEYYFQYLDDEIHWRIVVVQQQHFVHCRFFDRGVRSRDDYGVGLGHEPILA